MGKFLSIETIFAFFRFSKAQTVARALFNKLLPPNCFADIFFTPANSKTVRIELPAITPVPCEAGFINTLHAPNEINVSHQLQGRRKR